MSATIASLERRLARLRKMATTQQNIAPLSPVQMAREAGIQADAWQEELLKCQSQYILANCSRQTGKSLIAAVVAVHTALYQNNATILLLSPSLRQSSELFRKCMAIYNRLHRPVKPANESSLRLELQNASRIISLPGKEETIRGISAVSLLILDEASRIPDELFTAVRPMLAVSNGKLMLLSTPYGARGQFYEAYKHREEWHYFEIPATSCPRIAPEFLEKEKKDMGEWHFLQEYCCQFMATQAAQFRTVDIEAMVQEDIETWTF